MQLTLNAIEYCYPEAIEPVLSDVSVVFTRGWTGIVGDNGCGKSTLARIACGLLEPSSGAVLHKLHASYCEQDSLCPPVNMEGFSCSYDAFAIKLCDLLGIEDDWCWRYDSLSGGQQKRLQIACALWNEPDLLVMDEPTNHLDGASREAVVHALSSFNGIGLMISHDRALLDALCKQCVFISDGNAVMRPGTYAQGSRQMELELDGARRAHEAAHQEQKRIALESQRRYEEASRTASRRSAKHVAKHDSDARERRRLAVYSGQDGKAGKLSARMGSRLARANEKLARSAVKKRYEGDIWLDAAPSKKTTLLNMGEQRLALGGNRALIVPALWIERCDHIALVGANGSGKSTFVRKVASKLGQANSMLYIPQEPSAKQRMDAFERFNALSSKQRGQALSVVAQLNSQPERLLEGSDMSPGEMRKLMLGLGALDCPEVIVMDEPTNHMDLCSVEALERLLLGFPGALLLVSHDEALLKAVTTITWHIENTANDNYGLIVER